jgi:Peptidyl-tRNA hydrolase PTH2
MENKLYVFLRSDLSSMTVGKACAQVAHAASQCANYNRGLKEYLDWEMSPYNSLINDKTLKSQIDNSDLYGFGTTIVLDGGSFEDNLQFEDVKAGLYDKDFQSYGIVRDPTYPLRDGRVTHLLNIQTCFWIFDNPETNSVFKTFLRNYKLYNGNDEN